MPINTANLMPQLSPIAPLKPMDFGGSGSSMERQKLKLMREQFEETKRRNREDEELRRLSEQGELRRAEMLTQRQREQAEAQAAAKQRELAAGAYNDFYKARDVNDFAGMAAAAERLREFGGLADSLGTDEQGRPSYRVGMSADAYREQEAELDAQAAERPGNESLVQSLNRLSALGYDRTQEGVVDQGEFVDQRRAQLAPVLESYRQSLPAGAHRQSAERSDEAALLLGLSPLEGLKAAQGMRKDSGGTIDTLKDDIRADEQLDLDRERFGLDREKFEFEKSKTGEEKPLSRVDKQQLKNFGSADAKDAFVNRKVKASIDTVSAADVAYAALTDDNPLNDEMAVNPMMEMNFQVGTQTEKDAGRVTGENKASVVQRIKGFIATILKGGYDETTRKSMADYIDKLRTSYRAEVNDYIEAMAAAEGKEEDELVRRGYRDFVEANIPSSFLDAYREEAGEREEPEGAAEPQGQAQPQGEPINYVPRQRKPGSLESDQTFMDALGAAAEKWKISAEKLLPLLNIESAGEGAQADNPRSSASGIIQMIDEVARGFTNPRTGEKFKNAAELKELTAAEQADIAAEYIAKKGVDAASPIADYALAIAAPKFVGKSNQRDLVVYPKPANPETAGNDDPWVANKPWRPADGGDITVGSILDFYLGRAKPQSAELAPVGSSSAPPSAKTARARAQQRGEPAPTPEEQEAESAEDGIPDTRPRMRHLEKPETKKAHKNAGELDALME